MKLNVTAKGLLSFDFEEPPYVVKNEDEAWLDTLSPGEAHSIRQLPREKWKQIRANFVSINAYEPVLGNPQPGDYRFRLRSTGYSSARYGPCEVCGKHCTEVFLQAARRFFRFDPIPTNPCDPEELEGWAERPGAFGHEACLRELRTKYPPLATNDCPA